MPDSRSSSSAEFSRTELLLFLALLLLVALMGYAPIGWYLKQTKISHAVVDARTLSTLLLQYANDNDGVYPVGEGTPAAGKSEGIARNLLANNYTPDPGIFALGHTPKYTGKAADFSDFNAANISWDFTAGANATTGLTSTAPEMLPIVYSTGESVSFPTSAGRGLDLTLSGNGPFAKKGVVVAYKNQSARFIEASVDRGIATGFIAPDFQPTGTYTQIKP